MVISRGSTAVGSFISKGLLGHCDLPSDVTVRPRCLAVVGDAEVQPRWARAKKKGTATKGSAPALGDVHARRLLEAPRKR
jgi:hypothetical protein